MLLSRNSEGAALPDRLKLKYNFPEVSELGLYYSCMSGVKNS